MNKIGKTLQDPNLHDSISSISGNGDSSSLPPVAVPATESEPISGSESTDLVDPTFQD